MDLVIFRYFSLVLTSAHNIDRFDNYILLMHLTVDTFHNIHELKILIYIGIRLFID